MRWDGVNPPAPRGRKNSPKACLVFAIALRQSRVPRRGWEGSGGGDAGLNRVRYWYRLLLHIIAARFDHWSRYSRLSVGIPSRRGNGRATHSFSNTHKSWPTRATIPDRCRLTSATAISSTRCDTPSCRPAGSRTSGDDIRGGITPPVGAGSRVRRGLKSREQYSTSTELIPKVKARLGRIGVDRWIRHSQAAA